MIRNIQTIIPGIATSDGAGVKLRRSLGGQNQVRLDPFLMLDVNSPLMIRMIMLRAFQLIRIEVLRQ